MTLTRRSCQMILAIVGARDFNDYAKFKRIVLTACDMGMPVEITSGGATGVDSMARSFAQEHNIPIKEFLPDWTGSGKNAGLLRNTDIINYATHVIALPSVNSRGTYDSINKARSMGKPLVVVNV